jgi:hypothetical protein
MMAEARPGLTLGTPAGQLTVREMISYTAEMKRPMSESFADKMDAVDTVIDKLALLSCKQVASSLFCMPHLAASSPLCCPTGT